MDNMQPDRFDLLSAYLDNEVTPEERALVEEWLESDPEIRAEYEELLALHHHWQSAPRPQPSIAIAELESKVWAACEKQHRRRQAIYWSGGSAIAALFVGAVTFLGGDWQSDPQGSSLVEVPDDSLLIVVHRPAIEIPQAAVQFESNH